jgi:hypothetical protein
MREFHGKVSETDAGFDVTADLSRLWKANSENLAVNTSARIDRIEAEVRLIHPLEF